MAKIDSGASALARLVDGSSAGELIPELVRRVLQQVGYIGLHIPKLRSGSYLSSILEPHRRTDYSRQV
ncbi:hypothetical protein KBZ14_14270 [Synechococcus sp. HJ21-Hayes]|uniref:transposase n=1 Tax=unclassified Synechococcus TaxID=2626047 RepID=UPI0020CD44D1|nr:MULTISPECIES: transposase [unclassified Synechococcus]MCP9832101.1 hypothetical protein [Synechococcus sp. JJ3a-Johnson]MCP9854021.1 hypothetical protein [Synechococcus sp. HJ21-Hayes]